MVRSVGPLHSLEKKLSPVCLSMINFWPLTFPGMVPKGLFDSQVAILPLCGTKNASKIAGDSLYHLSYAELECPIFVFASSLLKILRFLAVFGVLAVSAQNELSFSSEKERAAQLKPPWELRKLSSELYEFLMTSDREGYAKTHQIFYQDGKVRVFILLGQNVEEKEKKALTDNYRIQIEKGSGDLIRAMVPADELASLAGETLVLSIRLPDRPMGQ